LHPSRDENAGTNPPRATRDEEGDEQAGGLSPRQWAVARQLVEGRSPRHVMRELSLSRWTLWRWRQNPAFQHAVARLQRDVMRSSADAGRPREVRIEATRPDAGHAHGQAHEAQETPSPFLQAVLRDNLKRMEAARREMEHARNKAQPAPTTPTPPPRISPMQKEVAGRAR
jgi:hypothetical protein